MTQQNLLKSTHPLSVDTVVFHSQTRTLFLFLSHVDEDQYKEALEHISVRAGTAIPTGAAERSLGSLYQQREEAWPFLAAHLAAAAAGDEREGHATPRTEAQPATGTDAEKDEAGVAGGGPVTSEAEEVVMVTAPDNQEDVGGGTLGERRSPGRDREGRGVKSIAVDGASAMSESFSLSRLSDALGAFARVCEDRGRALEDFAVKDLVNFFYLGGQTKASCYVAVGNRCS